MMKMKLLDRLILRFGALLTLVTGGISVAAGILLYGSDLGDSLVMRSLPLALIIAGAVAVIISVVNFLVARRYTARRKAFITQPNEMGELRIAVSAVENLIQKCVETHKEVRVQEMNVYNHRGSIDLDLRVSMNSNVSIPHAVEQLQSQIKRYLAASSGIEVHNITVSVDKTPGAPEPGQEEPLAEVEDKPEEKIPMHQRIFGRDPKKSPVEQITEAEMVTPPEETEAPETEEAPAAEEEAAPAAEAEIEDVSDEEPAKTQEAPEEETEEEIKDE